MTAPYFMVFQYQSFLKCIIIQLYHFYHLRTEFYSGISPIVTVRLATAQNLPKTPKQSRVPAGTRQ